MALYRLAYARVSSQDQNIELQIGQFEQLGYDELYQEKISGRKRDRPEFTKLKDRALELRTAGHDVQVQVIEWSRWARDTAFAMDTLKDLEGAGVVVLETTTGRPLTLQTADGLISTGMKSVMAHYYSVELGKRMERAYTARKRKNRPTSNRAIWGYKHSEDKSHWVPSEDWALCREAVERFMDGASIIGLCRWLAEQGTTKSRHGLLAWLKHPAIRGHSRHREEILYNTHQALITESEWRRIEYRIETNRQLRGRNKKWPVYAVPSSITKCHGCGRTMHAKVSTHGRYFFCYHAAGVRDGTCSAPRKWCRDDWVEAAIQNQLQERCEELAKLAIAPSEGVENPKVLELRREIEQLRPLSGREAIAQVIAELQAEIEQIESGASVLVADQQELRELAAAIDADSWLEMSPAEKRQAYSALVERVTIRGAEVIEVSLRF